MKIIFEDAARKLMQILETSKGLRFSLNTEVNNILPKLNISNVKITKGFTENALVGRNPAASLKFGNEEIRMAVQNSPHNVSGVCFEHLTPNANGNLEVTTKAIYGNDGYGEIRQLVSKPDGTRFVISRRSDFSNGQTTYVPHYAIKGNPKVTTLGSGMTIN